MIFQSTLPVWGATQISTIKRCSMADFNPRSPCGERRPLQLCWFRVQWRFQSTLPVWGATFRGAFCTTDEIISIHAPRVGSDFLSFPTAFAIDNFNPRSPCGERPFRFIWLSLHRSISIHAPRVGSDYRSTSSSTGIFIFQSTLPVWGAT